jgi:hypothetical protein
MVSSGDKMSPRGDVAKNFEVFLPLNTQVASIPSFIQEEQGYLRLHFFFFRRQLLHENFILPRFWPGSMGGNEGWPVIG